MPDAFAVVARHDFSAASSTGSALAPTTTFGRRSVAARSVARLSSRKRRQSPGSAPDCSALIAASTDASHGDGTRFAVRAPNVRRSAHEQWSSSSARVTAT